MGEEDDPAAMTNYGYTIGHVLIPPSLPLWVGLPLSARGPQRDGGKESLRSLPSDTHTKEAKGLFDRQLPQGHLVRYIA